MNKIKQYFPAFFQYMESVSSAYLEDKERALETEQLVTMTCKKRTNVKSSKIIFSTVENNDFHFSCRYVSKAGHG